MKKVSKAELALIARVFPKATIEKIERKSARAWDVRFEGIMPGAGFSYRFTAWLPLAAIRELTWTSRAIADECDYPMMAIDGDWSGIRDTNEEAIWRIFEKHVLKGGRS